VPQRKKFEGAANQLMLRFCSIDKTESATLNLLSWQRCCGVAACQDHIRWIEDSINNHLSITHGTFGIISTLASQPSNAIYSIKGAVSEWKVEQ
jgi:hypothetical protein